MMMLNNKKNISKINNKKKDKINGEIRNRNENYLKGHFKNTK